MQIMPQLEVDVSKRRNAYIKEPLTHLQDHARGILWLPRDGSQSSCVEWLAKEERVLETAIGNKEAARLGFRDKVPTIVR